MKKIKSYIASFKALSFISKKYLVQPIKLTYRHLLNCFLFDIKNTILALKLVYPKKQLYRDIFIHLCFLVAVCFCFKQGLKNYHYSDVFFVLSGSIISIWVAVCFEVVKKIYSNFKNTNNVFVLMSDMFHFSREVFLTFFCHPLKDSICKKDNNHIIYVSPITTGKFLDVNKLMEYMFFIQNLDNITFLQHFDEQQTREVINRLKTKQQWLQSLQITSLSMKDCLEQNILDLFLQFISFYINLLDYENYQWKDPQVKNALVIVLKGLIYKHCALILTLQQNLPKYEKYVGSVSHPPVFPIKELSAIFKPTEVNN